MTTGYIHQPVNTDLLFAISKTVILSADWKKSLNDLIRLIRPSFIFDNIALYLADADGQNLEIAYARAIGRGKKAEADVSWGEGIASQLFHTQKMILDEPKNNSANNRLLLPYTLGFPITKQKKRLGAILYIRFGGPPFTPEDVQLAEYISHHITVLAERKQFLHTHQKLEAQTQAYELQDNFISTISHELRSPLGFIKGYTTTLLRPDTSWDENTRSEFLRIIDHETDHLMDLIENMLDSARLQSKQLRMEFQYVRPDVLVNDAISRAQTHHPNMVIQIKDGMKLSPIIGDPRRLAQVFENLLNNSAKYAPDSEVVVSILQDEIETVIEVSDSGPGIKPEFQAYLFERFFRVPGQAPNIHGSGLGLFICKQIVDAHQGSIQVESVIGVGTKFSIRLPRNSNLIVQEESE
ncbi:MAG: GAF domain-containing sensor histidine kinase [Anaerolineaceae bacterium]|nr:GAF domain-containing sensor histidine kinase [Anaerolineaceae bacterium]NTV35889.1 GAF domain-containing sensor histidine kinase [Anaerolineaceae bacterium]